MFGIDISNHQKGINLAKDCYDFAIIKATEGNGFKDKSFDNYAVQLTELNKLIGCYHFARPDLNGTVQAMHKEADWFINVVKDAGLLGKAILILDWEKPPIYRMDLIQAFMEEVIEATGIRPFIYASKSVFSSLKFDDQPIWMAAWISNNSLVAGVDYKLVMPEKKECDWSIWQYSSKGIFPGYTGAVDLDYSSMTAEQWRIKASGKNFKPVDPPLTEAEEWGLYYGLSDIEGIGDPPSIKDIIEILYRYHNKFNF